MSDKKQKKSRARKTGDTPCKIYKYGIRLNKDGERHIIDTLRVAAGHYNDLVAIENGRRAAYRAARSAAVPGYADAELRCVALQDETDALAKRAKASEDYDDVSAENDARAASRAAWAALKPLREEADGHQSVKDESARIRQVAKSLAKNARKHSPLYWTTKGRVASAFQSAARSKGSVRFKRFEPCGGVGGQILKDESKRVRAKGYMTTASVYHCDSQHFQISKAAQSPSICDQIEREPVGTGRGGRPIRSGRIRIGSNGIKPVWLEFTAAMHRELPPDGVIKNAWIFARRCGNRIKYELHMTVEAESLRAVDPTRHTIGVALGHRGINGDAHVASAVGTDGSIRHLTLPADMFATLVHADSLKSAGDTHFDAARAVLSAYLDACGGPGWLCADTVHLAKWRSHKKLARVAGRLVAEQLGESRSSSLWRAWKAYRFAAAKDLFATFAEVSAWAGRQGAADPIDQLAVYLMLWRRKNAHLYQVESDLRRKVTARRDDIFRCWIAALAGHRLVLSDRNFAHEAMVSDEVRKEIRLHRSRCAPGRLKALLKEAGAEVVKTKASDEAAGMDSRVATAVGALEAAGEDMSAVYDAIEMQRAALRALREMDDAAE